MLISGAPTIAAHIPAGATPGADHRVTDLLANRRSVVGGAEARALGDPGASRVIAADVPTAAMTVLFIAYGVGRRTKALTRAIALVVIAVGISIVARGPFRSVGDITPGGRDARVDGACVSVVTEDVSGGQAISETAHIS